MADDPAPDVPRLWHCPSCEAGWDSREDGSRCFLCGEMGVLGMLERPGQKADGVANEPTLLSPGAAAELLHRDVERMASGG